MTMEIYTRRLTEMGIAFETVNDELQKKIDKTVFRVMEGRDDDNDRAIISEAISELRIKKWMASYQDVLKFHYYLARRRRQLTW